jgi:hypothetical protein
VIGLLAVYAAYLVAANLFLNTPFGQQAANRQPEKFRAAWSAAWSLYPGHVHVRDLRLAGHVRRTVWSVQADEAIGRVALLPLLAREIRIPRVVARGASGGATRIDAERPRPEPRPGGWTLRFDDLAVDSARYAYFNQLVLLGDGRVRTAFSKVMRGGPMEVLPSTAHFDSARLLGWGEELLRESTVDGGFAIARHVSKEAPGIRKLEKMDIEVSLDGTSSGLSVVAAPGQRPAMRVVRDEGRVSGQVGWQRGALRAGSELELVVPVTYGVAGGKHRDVIDATLEAGADDIRLAGRLEAGPGSAFEADLHLDVAGREIPVPDWERLIERSDGELKAGWHFDSLAWLSAMLPAARIVSFDGAGTVLADLKIEQGKLAPGSELKVPAVSASLVALGNRFRGEADARVSFAADEPGRVSPRLDAIMRTFRVEPADASSAPYVEGRNLELEATAEGTLAELGDRFKARVRFADARVPDLRVYNRYLPQSHVSITGGSGRLSGDLAFDGDEEVGSGVLKVSGQQARLDVAALTLEGDIDLTTRLRRGDLERTDFDMDGSTLSLRNVRVAAADGSLASDWWIETDLPRARLDWGKPMRVDGRARMRMKDLSVLLALYAQKKELPSWVGKLIDEGEANAEGRIRWDGTRLALDGVKGHNDRFEVGARLQLQDKHLSGDLFAQWGVLSLGVDVDAGNKDFHLVHARKWFDSQPALLAD